MEIIDAEISLLEGWFQGLDIVPTIRHLREKYHSIAEKEIAKWATGQSEETRVHLEALGRSLLNKFLHEPTSRLKQLAAEGDGKRASYFAGMLFALSQKEGSDEKN
jgi:glutamyl-tRNA reductase